LITVQFAIPGVLPQNLSSRSHEGFPFCNRAGVATSERYIVD
jgi:hypothetical protein